MLTGKRLSEIEKVVRVDDERHTPVKWCDLVALKKSGTAQVIFNGIGLADNLTTWVRFTVHPIGESFEPFGIALKLADAPAEANYIV